MDRVLRRIVWFLDRPKPTAMSVLRDVRGVLQSLSVSMNPLQWSGISRTSALRQKRTSWLQGHVRSWFRVTRLSGFIEGSGEVLLSFTETVLLLEDISSSGFKSVLV